MDKSKIEALIKELLTAIGENPDRKELKKTPERVAAILEKTLSGAKKDANAILQTTHELKHDEMVVVKNVPFYSMCEHHLMPFFGKCHIGYIPKNNRIAGIGRFVELIDVMSKRLQVQERLTTEIANTIMKNLNPKGVGVVIEARHLCSEMMGQSIPHSSIITSAVRGRFRSDIKTREEFLKLIKN